MAVKRFSMRIPSSLICLQAALCLAYACTPAASELTVVTTGDIHGSYFPDSYVETRIRPSLMSVKLYVDSLREAVGKDNVILLDAGDFLQGDNAAYYFNYVADTLHVYPRMAAYMGYDVVVGGNHDIETGHAVYDRVASELKGYGIPFLSGNAFKPDGSLYFPDHVLLRKGGRKVLVLGFNNANIASWLSEEVWSGMRFESLVPLVQGRVDELSRKYRPDVVIVVAHTGTGDGNGDVLESQGMDIYRSMKGVDLLVTAHDHRPFVETSEHSAIINSGSRAGNVGHVTVTLGEKPVPGAGNELAAEVVRLDKNAVDEDMKAIFREDYESVKDFTLRKVGTLEGDMYTRDAYVGMCDYMNLVHSVQLSLPEVQVSFSAPLKFDGTVKSGTLVYNDMFTIYPYENQLFVVRMKGSEIVSYLENSYDNWISFKDGHVLKIVRKEDPHTSESGWSFETRPYNLDSAAGLNYTVNVLGERGSRVSVTSMADGSAFDPEAWYNVAMTSYRANGGGGLVEKGAGLTSDMLKDRVVARYPEIRELIYRYITDNGIINHELVSLPSVVGRWSFIPEKVAGKALENDMALLFPHSR